MTNSNKTNTTSTTDLKKPVEVVPFDESKGAARELFWFLLAAVLLLAMVFWPFTKRLMTEQWDARNAPDVVTYAGTVQSINFVGSFFRRTQVDTETEPLLVFDYVALPKGTPLELREDYYSRRLCVAGTLRCWKVSRR